MKPSKNYKLYQIIQTLDKKEVRQIKRVLQSPFFVLRNDVGNLFEVLIKYHLKGKPFPKKEVVFQKTFPNKKYDYVLLRGTMSDLFELIEEYFLIKKRRDGELKTRHLLAEIYRERKLSKAYQSVVKKTTTILEKQPLRNEFYFRQLLDFQLEKMEFEMSNQRTKNFNLAKVSETIDIVFLVQKLKHTCTQFTHQQVFKTDYDFGLLPHLLPIIEQEKYLNIPAIAIYYYCYRFLTGSDGDVFFEKFKAVLFQNKKLFNGHELKELYLFAINFCIRKLNQGDKKFSYEILELYKDGLQANYFLENGILSRFTFNNIVAAGIVTEDFDWAENFIETYAEKIELKYRNQTVSFNLARLEYTRKNYGAAMLHLQNAEYKDLVNNLIAKTILIKIYYELEEYDSLFSHLDSFQIFIRRREVSDFHRKNYMNIIRLVKKLVELPELDKEMRQQLRKEIEKEKVLTEREWLLSKT
ncbi:MAG TPA: hypothetical protein ENJ53_10345 [Phaeodactylibacter sp.]|nr:hypothetical protein [Phaeodactylibacter sp.]